MRKPREHELDERDDERRARDLVDFAREITRAFGPRGYRTSAVFQLAGDREEQS